MSEISSNETKEIKQFKPENYRSIQPEKEMTLSEAKEYWNKEFGSSGQEGGQEKLETTEKKDEAEAPRELVKEYFNELKEKSDFPETIYENRFNEFDLKKQTPEETKKMREEFDDKKAQLKKEWEKLNGREWPKYNEDVYSKNGKLIRKAGSDYDVHHIQPLSLGGKNEVGNITPLHAEVHYDKQGVHAPGSACSKLLESLGGVD